MSIKSIRAREVVCPQWNNKAEKGSDYWYVTISDSEQMVFSVQERADFIAHARTDIPLLLKVAEAAAEADRLSNGDLWGYPHGEQLKAVRAALAELEASE